MHIYAATTAGDAFIDDGVTPHVNDTPSVPYLGLNSTHSPYYPRYRECLAVGTAHCRRHFCDTVRRCKERRRTSLASRIATRSAPKNRSRQERRRRWRGQSCPTTVEPSPMYSPWPRCNLAFRCSPSPTYIRSSRYSHPQRLARPRSSRPCPQVVANYANGHLNCGETVLAGVVGVTPECVAQL
jgi:hypothetical protein